MRCLSWQTCPNRGLLWLGWGGGDGFYGDENQSGFNVGLVLEIWSDGKGELKAAAYIDDRASHAAYEALINISVTKLRALLVCFLI